MSDSNNIYNILGKLEALKPTAQEKHDATVKAIYESVEAQGSIISGVDAVQSKLAEAFAAEKANNPFAIGMAAAKKQAGITKTPAHDLPKKVVTKGHEITKKIDVEEGCTCSEGTCAMHENADGVNDVDMPTASPAEPAGSPAEPKGTVTVSADPDSGHIDPSEYIEEDDLEEAEITRKAGVTTHRKTDFPGYPADDLNEPDVEPTDRKRGRPRKHAAKAPTGLGRGRPVKAAAPSYSKQADPFGRVSGTVPKGTKGTVHSMSEAMNTLGNKLARITEGVNFQKMAEETNQTIDELMNELQNDIKEYKTTGHCSDKLKDFMQVHAHSKKQVADEAIGGIGQDLVSPEQRVAQATPQKPGIMGAVKDVAQGAKNWIQGKPEQGPTYEEAVDPMEEELRKLAELAGLGEVSRGDYIKQQDTKAERSGKHEFNAFGQLFNTDEIKEEPNEGNAFTAGLEDDDVKIGDKIPGTNAIKTKDIDTVDEADVTVDEPTDDELANEPNTKYGTIKTITTQGDDMNRQKRQFADKPKLGDNPMATLEAKLAKEYESIKKKVTDPHKAVNKEVSFDEEDNTLSKAKAK